MKISLPYKISGTPIVAVLSLQLRVRPEMSMLATESGYGPEELQNLIRQEMQMVALQVASALGIEYDPEPGE